MDSNSSRLTAQAQKFLCERGLLDSRLLARCGIVDLPSGSLFSIAGITWEALRIPYPLPDSTPSGFNRYRFIPNGEHAVTPDNPAEAKLPGRTKQSKGKSNKDAKPQREDLRYWQPAHTGVHLYLPPLVNWVKAMANWQQPLIIAEGEFKAIAACHVLGTPACGIGGVWNWKPADGLILPEFQQFAWRDPAAPAYDFDRARTVYIVFDSDVRRRGDLLAARDGLVEQLTDRGANAVVINLPEVLHGKTG